MDTFWRPDLHLATENKSFLVANWRLHEEVNFGPCKGEENSD